MKEYAEIKQPEFDCFCFSVCCAPIVQCRLQQSCSRTGVLTVSLPLTHNQVWSSPLHHRKDRPDV